METPEHLSYIVAPIADRSIVELPTDRAFLRPASKDLDDGCANAGSDTRGGRKKCQTPSPMTRRSMLRSSNVSPVSALHGLLPRRSIYDSAIPRGAASRLAHPSVRSKERI